MTASRPVTSDKETAMSIQALNTSASAVAANVLTARSDASAAVASAPQAGPASAAQAEPSLDQVKQAAQAVQQVIQTKTDNLQFSVDHDQDTGQSIVKLMDKQSGETILQIPSKGMVEIAQQIDKIVGMFVQKKA